MVNYFKTAVKDDDDIAQAFAGFQKHFQGVIMGQEDAVRLAALEARGAGKLDINVNSWPLAAGPGFALMYDAALETLRSTDLPIEPQLIGARLIEVVESSLDRCLPFIGSMTVTALELALNDKNFGDHLRARASELAVYLPPPTGPCQSCVFTYTDPLGNKTVTCGTPSECSDVGIIFIVLLVLGLLKKLWGWLS